MTDDSERKTARRRWIGAALILALVGLAVLIFFLDEIERATAERYQIVAVLPNADELRRGSAVRVAGHEVGQIVEVEVLPRPEAGRGPVAARLELPARVRFLVRHDSEVAVKTDFNRDPVVEIMPGSAEAAPLAEGDTLVAAPPIGLDRVVAQARRVAAALDSVIAAGTELRAAVPDARARFRRLASAAERARAEAGRLAGAAEEGTLTALLGDTSFAATVARLRGAAAEVGAAVEARAARARLIRAEAGEIAPAIERLTARADSVARRLERLRTLAEARGGFAARATRDTALQAALSAARAQLDSLVAEIQANPLRLVF